MKRILACLFCACLCSCAYLPDTPVVTPPVEPPVVIPVPPIEPPVAPPIEPPIEPPVELPVDTNLPPVQPEPPPVNTGSHIQVGGSYFTDGTKAVVIMGDHNWSLPEEFTETEIEAWFDVLQDYGINAVMFSAWLSKYDRAKHESGGYGAFIGGGGNCPGSGKDDCWQSAVHSQQYNQEYLDRLERIVAMADVRGICSIVTIGGFPCNSRWWKKFMHQLWDDRWFVTIVDLLEPYNVMWGLYGEVDEADPPWGRWENEVRHKINLIREHDDFNHPIGSHNTPEIDKSSVNQVDFIVAHLSSSARGLGWAGLMGRWLGPRSRETMLEKSWGLLKYDKPVMWQEYWYESAGYDNDVTHGIRNTYMAFCGANSSFTMGSLMRAHSSHSDFPPNHTDDLRSYLKERDTGLRMVSYFVQFASQFEVDRFAPATHLSNASGMGRFGDNWAIFKKGGGTLELDIAQAPYLYQVTVTTIDDGVTKLLESITGADGLRVDLGTTKDCTVSLIREE